jgi:uncharacterized membrane protein
MRRSTFGVAKSVLLMGKVEVSILIRAPVSRVWNYYVDVGRLQEWILGGNIIKFEWFPPPKRIGSRFRVSCRVAGMTSTWVAEMVEMMENKKAAYRLVEGDLKRYEETSEFEPVGEETRVTFRMDYELPYGFVGKLLDGLLVNKSLRKNIQAMLERLKSNIERPA